MGQGQSAKSTQPSKYEPSESTTSSASPKQKNKSKRNKSSPTTPPVTQNGSKKKHRAEEKNVIPRPTSLADRKLPAVPPSHSNLDPPQSARTHSHRTKKNTTHSPGSERNTSALPSRQFSLTKQTPSISTSGGNSVVNKLSMIEKYFNQYKDKEEDIILAEGMERFCTDLNVDPTEFIVLVLAWKFDASQMCQFTREEFVNGCREMKAYDAKSLQNRFPELLEDARGKNFKDLYQFTFNFGLDHSTGQRSLPIDMAIPLWELVFTQEHPPILERWFAFLREGDVRGISRDTWNMFLPFCQSVAPDLRNYDESEAWPSLFDDFVEYELSK